MIIGLSILELSSGNHLTVLSHYDLMTLTFDLVTQKSIGVICESWSMYLWSFMILGVSLLELSSGNHFTVLSHHDLDLWPSDMKINRGYLPVMTSVPMKFRDPRPKRSWVIIRKPFYCFRSLWPWPLTWKSIGVIFRSWPMSLWSFMIPGVSVLELSSGNHFPISSNRDLDLWPWPLT